MPDNVTTFEDIVNTTEIKPHILHFWLKKFPNLQNNINDKNGFSPKDISFINGLKLLIMDEGKSIKQVQKLLNEKGEAYISAYGKNKSRPINALEKKTIFSSKADSLLSAVTNNMTKDKLSVIFSKSNEKKQESSELSKDNFDDFEKSWKNFMQDKGKVGENNTTDNNISEDDEILFIDDGILPDENETLLDITNEDSIEEKNVHGIDTESHEKIKNILTKIKLIRDDLVESEKVINKTLKEFGSSGFDNPYKRYEKKQAY